MAVNTASFFSKKIDERFYQTSLVAAALNNDYQFNGVKTVTVFSIPTVALTNYDREGTNDSTTAFHRYGTPSNLGNNVQNLTITQDKSFSFIIDRLDKEQTQMTMDAGKALSREIREVVVPEYDVYVLNKLATVALGNSGFSSSTAASSSNAYDLFLAAQEKLSNAMVPLGGRICFASYKFANLLSKQDSGFRLSSELSQKQLINGEIPPVDGVRIIRVPQDWLPKKTASGTTTYADFILTHSSAATAPRQLVEYKTHDNPPGISGWLVEGRIVYDCFVLNNKKNAIFYQGPTLSS